MLHQPISFSNSSSGLDLFSSFTAMLLGEVDGTFNLALNSILGPRPLWQRWCGWSAFMILLSFYAQGKFLLELSLLLLQFDFWFHHRAFQRAKQPAVSLYPGYHFLSELPPILCFLHMPAKGVEHLNFEQNSILEGYGLCQADRMGRLGSQSACQAKRFLLLCLSFLHYSSDFRVHVVGEGLLTHIPFFILESPWTGPTDNLFCTLVW